MSDSRPIVIHNLWHQFAGSVLRFCFNAKDTKEVFQWPKSVISEM